jgi:hypothetical protein
MSFTILPDRGTVPPPRNTPGPGLIAALVAVVVVAGGAVAYKEKAGKPAPAPTARAAAAALAARTPPGVAPTITAPASTAAPVTPTPVASTVTPPSAVAPPPTVVASTPAAPASAVAPAPAPVDNSPGAVLVRKALSDAAAEGWMHFDGIETDADGSTIGYSSDSGTTRAIEQLAAEGASATVIVIDTTAYVKGSTAILVAEFGLSTAQAEQLAGRWLTLQPGDQGYDDLTDAVTLGSALSESGVAGPVTELPEQIRHGIRVIGVRGGQTGLDATPGGSATLWISTGSHPLPVELDETAGGGTFTGTFSRWGVAAGVTAPVGAVPVPPDTGQAT